MPARRKSAFRNLKGLVERRVRQWFLGGPPPGWDEAPYVSETFSPIVVGGCGRSGTTLLSIMLDSHPHMCCGPESRIFVARGISPRRLARLFRMPRERVRELVRDTKSKGEFIERFAREHCKAAGATRWVEKSPGNVLSIPYVFELFPKARFIHVIRDGRDVVCSLRTHPKYKLVRGKRVETGIKRPIPRCTQRWVDYVVAGLKHRDDPRYMEVRYEDLITATEPTLRRVLDFIGEPWDDAMLRFHERQLAATDPSRTLQNPGIDQSIYTSAMGRWRTELSADDLAAFEKIGGELLRRLGYQE